MNSTENFLAHHPIIGFVSTLIGFIAPFIDGIIPVLQLLTLIVGLGIGLLTLEAKLKERKNGKTK